MNLHTYLKSIFIGLFVVLTTYSLTILFQYIGLQDVNPGAFFSKICAITLIQGWVVYGLISILMTVGYIRFCKVSIIKSVLGSGLIWGFVFFMVSQLMIAVVRALYHAPKDPQILAKSLSLFLLKLSIGIVIAYSVKIFNKFRLSSFSIGI